jgi:hypothetical protein
VAAVTDQPNTTIFQAGEFRAHSGGTLPFKIECDALSDAEINLFADLALSMRPGARYSRIIGIPRGGLRLAAAIRERAGDPDPMAPILIADDVLTTGRSMDKVSATESNGAAMGVVIFARGPCPYWIKPIFSMNEALHV